MSLLTTLHWWREAGFVKLTSWRVTLPYLPLACLWVLPALSSLILGGARVTDLDMILLACASYLAGAFIEEAIFRGVVLRALLPGGLLRANLLAATLFATVHLAGLAAGDRVDLAAFDRALAGVAEQNDVLVAPMLEKGTERNVYLPNGKWIDYQTGKVYTGGWNSIKVGKIPVVMLVRDGAVIPHIKLAQSTTDMDWSSLELVAFASDAQKAQGLVCLPSDNVLHEILLMAKAKDYSLVNDPFAGKVKLKIQHYTEFVK